MNIYIPEDTKRIILISNTVNHPDFSFKEGDLVVEMNRAVHHDEITAVLSYTPVNKFLFIRHNKDGHFFPENFIEKSSTWDNIVLSSSRFGFCKEKWFKQYFNATHGKTPTTGFALYKYFRARKQGIMIIGLGFNIDDHSTPHSSMHDWFYEFEEYKKDKRFQNIYA